MIDNKIPLCPGIQQEQMPVHYFIFHYYNHLYLLLPLLTT